MGLDERLFVEPASIPRDLHCPICLEVLDQPVFAGGRPCQHVFCQVCIANALQRCPQCPICKQDMAPQDLFASQAAKSQLEVVHVRCIARGCGWTGPFHARSLHLSECLVPDMDVVQGKLDSSIKHTSNLENYVKEELVKQIIANHDEWRKELQCLQEQVAQLQEEVTYLKRSSKPAVAEVTHSVCAQETEESFASAGHRVRSQFDGEFFRRMPLDVLLGHEQAWDVIGDQGIIVHESWDVRSPEKMLRLALGTRVQQLGRKGDMMKFLKVDGAGPVDGWVRVRTDCNLFLREVPPGTEKTNVQCAQLKALRGPLCLLFRDASMYLVLAEQEGLGVMLESPAIQVIRQKFEALFGYDVLDRTKQNTANGGDWAAFFFMADIAGLVKLWHIRPELILHPKAILGRGLGDITALYAAGIRSLDHALRLVHLRGVVHHEFLSPGLGSASVSVVGLPEDIVANLCREAQAKLGGDEFCEIAEYNFHLGFVCAGTERAVVTFKELAETAGAFRVSDTKHSKPWYTKMLRPFQDQFNKLVEELSPRMLRPQCQLYMCATGSEPIPTGQDPAIIHESLKRHFIAPCQWSRAIDSLIAEGIVGFCIMGPVSRLENDLKEYIKYINKRLWKNTFIIRSEE